MPLRRRKTVGDGSLNVLSPSEEELQQPILSKIATPEGRLMGRELLRMLTPGPKPPTHIFRGDAAGGSCVGDLDNRETGPLPPGTQRTEKQGRTKLTEEMQKGSDHKSPRLQSGKDEFCCKKAERFLHDRWKLAEKQMILQLGSRFTRQNPFFVSFIPDEPEIRNQKLPRNLDDNDVGSGPW